MSSVYRECLHCHESNWVPERGAKENTHPCPKCQHTEWRDKKVDTHRRVSQLVSPDHDWHTKNGGRGEYISQLEDKPNGKRSREAYCRSMAELREKAKRKGFDVNNTY